MTNKTKGFIYGAIAAASYGMNPLFALPLYAAGMSVDTVLFYRYFFATIVLGILMKMQHQSFALHKADVLPLVIMGLLFSFSSLLLFFLKLPVPEDWDQYYTAGLPHPQTPVLLHTGSPELRL